jgi:fermentation-respiration switch protein FrsA (DUF1100 family)
MMRSVLMLVALAAVLLVTLWAGQRRLIYFPDSRVPAPGAAGLAGVEEVVFRADDGTRLAGWFVPADDRVPRGTVLAFNGNAGNRAYRAPFASALRRHGLNVLLFDYRGFGGSTGSPTESGLMADGRAALAYLMTRRDVDPLRLVFFGDSLGTAVATALAAAHPPAALVLRSPFASIADVGAVHYPFLPVRLLLRDRFSAIDLIPRVTSPLLVIMGGRDQIVPPDHSRRLYEAATARKEILVLPEADHNDVELLAGDEMIDAIVGFLGRVMP